jgi:hypothetical protein
VRLGGGVKARKIVLFNQSLIGVTRELSISFAGAED